MRCAHSPWRRLKMSFGAPKPLWCLRAEIFEGRG
jgi:hypothetical protein